MADTLYKTNTNGGLWIGLQDNKTWVDGSAVDFAFFYSGQGYSYNGVYLWVYDGSYDKGGFLAWFSNLSEASYGGYICEIKL